MTACHAIHISKNKEFVLLVKERGLTLDHQSEQH